MSLQLIAPLSEGFLLSMGLIIGFGPQNSFILQQGMKRKFVFMIALLATLIDGGLILLGVGGAANYFANKPNLMLLVTCSGAAFLLYYGLKSLTSALKHKQNPTSSLLKPQKLGRQAVIMSILAVSLLNPSTYLDTMFIIGGTAAQYSDSLRTFFAIGAALASLLWFFILAYGAAKLSKTLQNPIISRFIDALSAVIMWIIAAKLLLNAFIH